MGPKACVHLPITLQLLRSGHKKRRSLSRPDLFVKSRACLCRTGFLALSPRLVSAAAHSAAARTEFTTPPGTCQIPVTLWHQPFLLRLAHFRQSLPFQQQRDGSLSHPPVLVKSDNGCDLGTKRPADPTCNLLAVSVMGCPCPTAQRLRFFTVRSLYQKKGAMSSLLVPIAPILRCF